MTSTGDCVDLLKFVEELRKVEIITEKVKADFSALDHSRLDYKQRVKFLLDQLYNIVSKDPLICDWFMHALDQFEKTGESLSYFNEFEWSSCYGENPEIGEKRPRTSDGIVLKGCTTLALANQSKMLSYIKDDGISIDTLARKFRKISLSATLILAKQPKRSEFQWEDIEIRDGMSILLGAYPHTIGQAARLSIDDSPSKCLNFQWMKDGECLVDDLTYLGAQNEILFIKNSCQGLEGKYTCCINCVPKRELDLSITYPSEKKELMEQYSFTHVVASPFSDKFNLFELTFQSTTKGERRPYKFEEIFHTYESGALIAITGLRGSGKTMLTHRLARDWAVGPNILKGAKLVFVFSVQVLAINNCKQLSDILQLFYNEETAHRVEKMLESYGGEGACFVIDGLDERNCNGKNNNVINKLLLKESLPRSMVIATSCLSHTRLPDKAQMTKCYEILGIDKTQVHHLQQYRVNAKKMEELLKLLKSPVHYEAMYINIACFICETWEGKSPDSIAKMYELYIKLLIEISSQNDSGQIIDDTCNTNNTLTKLSNNTTELFQRLCKFSYEIIRDNNTVDQSLKNNSDVLYLTSLNPDPISSMFGIEPLYSCHMSLHKFLAASYIISQEKDTQLQIFRSLADRTYMWIVWNIFWDFLGFKDSKNQSLERLMKSKIDSLYKVYCAYFSQEHAVCNSIFSNVQIGELSFKNYKLLPTDCKAIAYTISVSCMQSTKLIVENSQNYCDTVILKMSKHDDDRIRWFSVASEMDKFHVLNRVLKSLSCLEVLILVDVKLGKQCIELLADGVSLPSLRTLEIQTPSLSRSDLIELMKYFKCEIIPSGEVHLPPNILANVDVDLKFVKSFLNLADLILVNCNLDDSRIQYLSSVQLDKLHTLKLDLNHISCDGAEYISSVMGKVTGLVHFSASCNNIGDRGAEAIAQTLTDLKKLTKLDMQCNAFGDRGAIAISNAYRKESPETLQLFLYNIKITSEGARRIKDCVKTAEMTDHTMRSWKHVFKHSAATIKRAVECCTHVETINLAGQGISAHGTVALANSLNHCTNLLFLDLSNCKIGFDGMKALKELKHCTKLRSLNLADNKIDAKHLRFIVSGLKNCKYLKKLNLASNSIGHKGIFTLVSELKGCSMQMLNLRQANLKSEGAVVFSRWLDITCDKCSGYSALKLPLPQIHSVSIYGVNSNHNLWSNTLESLDLTNNYIGFDGMSALTECLKCCIQLQTLSLTGNELGDKGAIILAYGLKYCCNLRILNLDYNSIGQNGMVKLSRSLKLCLKLQYVNIARNSVRSEGAITLLKALKECTELHTLNLQENQIIIDTNFTNAFSLGLKCWNNFKKVNLSNNEGKGEVTFGVTSDCQLQEMNLSNLNAYGTIDLQLECPNLQLECPNLKVLKLSHVNISLHSVKILAYGLRNSTKIHTLDLSFTKLNAKAVKNLVACLERLKLRSLNLEGNTIGSEGISVLASCLCWTDLEIINLNSNKIGLEGMKYLADKLNGAVLKELHISDNGIGPTGTCVLQSLLTEGTPVQELVISKNNIGFEGASELSKSLENCSCLQLLNLEGNNIDGEGAKKLADGLKSCRSIKTLRLGYNKIKNKEALLLAQGLVNCRSLKALNLTANPADNFKELNDILPYCTISTRSKVTSNRLQRSERKTKSEETILTH